MKRYEINKKLTEIVSGYITAGYVINTNSMTGHQGEEGKVDLVKDDKLVRVWLDREIKFSGVWQDYVMNLRVGVWNYPAKESTEYGRTVWFNDIEIINEIKFYQIESDWYVRDLESSLRIKELRKERLHNRHKNSVFEKRFTEDKYKSLAKDYLKRKVGYKRVSEDDIVVVRKSPLYKEGGHEYYINYKGVTYRLS